MEADGEKEERVEGRVKIICRLSEYRAGTCSADDDCGLRGHSPPQRTTPQEEQHSDLEVIP